eukprot:TRINITY_DN57405_c0_g1_i1.p2 TRINITY_DN57405_c0_g1~~TRINITY_DN57405_c0_g1_i1.p2  ORF type:complete len:457 (+),score=152.30 TRINITY_DN57405_c0_g1_i1:68-1438(+)
MMNFTCCFEGVSAAAARSGVSSTTSAMPTTPSGTSSAPPAGDLVVVAKAKAQLSDALEEALDLEASEASTSMPPSPGGSLPAVLSVLALPWQEASLNSFLTSADLSRLAAACAPLLEELTVDEDEACEEGRDEATTDEEPRARRALVVPVLELNMLTVEKELARVSLPHVRTVRVDSRLSFNALAARVRGGAPCRQLRQLERFALKGCGLHAADVREMLEPILAATRSLKLLNAERNRVSCDAVKALAASEVLRRVETLNLRFNNISDAGAKALAESPYLRFIQVLNLKQNRITDVGAKAFATALAENDTLRNLNLRRQTPPLTDKAAFAFAEMLRTNTGLQLLRLRRNRVGDLGAEALAEASAERLARLSAQRSLDDEVRLELDLEENRVGDKGAVALLRMAAAAPLRARLEVLLHSNHVTSESLRIAAAEAGEEKHLAAAGDRVSFDNKPEYAL